MELDLEEFKDRWQLTPEQLRRTKLSSEDLDISQKVLLDFEDKFIEYIYKGNKTFIINAVQHLCNSPNVNQLKSKKIKLRLLDKSITKSYRNLIQLLNIFVPLLFLLIIFYIKKIIWYIFPNHGF